MNKQDIVILKELSKRVAELAALPEQEEKRELWRAHNMLKAVRPVVFCDPEFGWREIIRNEDLLCTDEQARAWESHFRKMIFWGTQMGDDRVIEPYFDVPYVASNTGYGITRVIHGGGNGKAYSWEPMIKDFETDFPKLNFPQTIIDEQASRELLALAQELFEPTLRVRRRHVWWWTLGLTSIVIQFRGIEQFMFDMYDNPEQVHSMMGFLCDGTLNMLSDLEARGLLSSNADDAYVGSGGFGYTDELPKPDSIDGAACIKDMWGFCESQETVSVSPEMFKEFVFPYQMKILEKFGLNCYGCCEPVNTRWHVLEKIPNLRRVSVSPWADIPQMAEYLGENYILSMKPNPSYISTASPDFVKLEKDLKQSLKTTKNCRVEIIMKDNNTIGGNPQNVIEWCKIAKKLAESV